MLVSFDSMSVRVLAWKDDEQLKGLIPWRYTKSRIILMYYV